MGALVDGHRLRDPILVGVLGIDLVGDHVAVVLESAGQRDRRVAAERADFDHVHGARGGQRDAQERCLFGGDVDLGQPLGYRRPAQIAQQVVLGDGLFPDEVEQGFVDRGAQLGHGDKVALSMRQ